MFPYYKPAAIEALNRQAVTLLRLFASHGYAREEPSVLQPAALFLDRSGEEIRRRTFTLTDPAGRDLALRPDLTIPIAKTLVDFMIEEGERALPARVSYNGPVFRHEPSRYEMGAPDKPVQFFQAGVELFGENYRAKGDAEILSLAIEALRAAGLKDFTLRMGDLGLFGALVDDLDLPAHWRSRLKRHFWRPGYARTLLTRIGHGEETSRLPQDTREIEKLLDAQGEAPPSGRSRAEVIARARAEAAEVLKLDGNVAGAITKLLDISAPIETALAEIRALLATAGIRLDAELQAVEARLALLKSRGVDPARIEFTAHFGRSMEYYTGFVFELRDGDSMTELAGGGRYDNLLELLGAPHPVTAVGCAIHTERLLAAAKTASGGAS
jgi:ATP phosphoribosyltransferase regulatory subunit